jgi:RsiW-degrading membrane proteinase PrsW (M82 family)
MPLQSLLVRVLHDVQVAFLSGHSVYSTIPGAAIFVQKLQTRHAEVRGSMFTRCIVPWRIVFVQQAQALQVALQTCHIASISKEGAAMLQQVL